MKLFRARAALAAAVFAFSLAACSGGGVSPNGNTLAPSQGSPGNPALTSVFSLSPAGGRYSLPLPQGYSGAVSVGANRAPHGTQVRLDVSGNGMIAGGAAPLSATPRDPFPIFIGIQLPFAITLPVPGFTINFPRTVNMQGTFDVSFYDPTMAAGVGTNPALLGQAVISGQTLTFTPQPNATVAFLPAVQYTFIISRDMSSGSTNSVILPVQSGVTQTLASVGPLGALVNYQASPNAGFLNWETISGSPLVVPQLIFGDQPLESIVVSASQTLTLTNTTVTGVFANNSGYSALRTGTKSSARMPFATSSSPPSPAPGTFVPDPNPTIYGPFPATVNGNQTSFTVPNALPLGGKRAWDFSLVTVTVCAPLQSTSVCNDATNNNLLTSVGTNTQFNVLVSDSSGLLTQSYNLIAAGACAIASESNENSEGSDVPTGYNDNAFGPNAEFEVLSGLAPGTCTLTATYNGAQVAQTSVAVSSSYANSIAVPYTLRPPVNGPAGFAISGATH